VPFGVNARVRSDVGALHFVRDDLHLDPCVCALEHLQVGTLGSDLNLHASGVVHRKREASDDLQDEMCWLSTDQWLTREIFALLVKELFHGTTLGTREGTSGDRIQTADEHVGASSVEEWLEETHARADPGAQLEYLGTPAERRHPEPDTQQVGQTG
jgi:hypothetical protein